MAAALDIEHYIKVRLNRAFMDDDACDGYQVVEDFMQLDANRKAQNAAKGLSSVERMALAEEASVAIVRSVEKARRAIDHDRKVEAVIEFDKSRSALDETLGGLNLNHIEQSIARLEASSYLRSVAKKYGQRGTMAYWSFLEPATFGDIISFYKYYFNDVRLQSDPVAKRTKRLLFPAKTLRNAAAHNSCLLNELRRKMKEPVGLISRHMGQECGIDAGLVAQTKRVPIVHDFGALLIAYDAIVISTSSRAEMSNLLQAFGARVRLHLDYFMKQSEVYHVLSMLSAMADAFSIELKEACE